MKALYLIAFLFLGIHNNQAQENQAQENQALETFTKVLIKGNLEVDLVPGTQAALDIEKGEENRIEFFVKDDQLVVRHREMYKYKSYRDFPIKVTITYAELRKLDVRAGARVAAESSISAIRLDMHLGSGARFKGDIQAEKVDIDIAEGAMAELTGRVSRFTGIASTGANLCAFEMTAEDSRVRSTMGGMIQVSAFKSLDAKANMGGSIMYQGKPEQFVMVDDFGGTICRKN